jgi:hypothetical protein
MTFKLLLSTAVWGENYLEIFLEYTLKSLLTNSNLLNKNISKKSEYLIFTKNNYINIIRSHTNFKKLEKKIKIKFFNLKISNSTEKYSSLKHYQNLSIRYGYKYKFNYYTFIYPDSVFGENHFQSLFLKIKKGYKVVLCPGPLGIYEKFFQTFQEKEINNINLSDFMINNLHPFYKNFLKNDINARIKITEDKEKNYHLYECFDLHPAIISLSIEGLKIIKTYDVDILANENIELSDLGYLNHSSEGMIITLESIFSERGKIVEKPLLNSPQHAEYNALNILDIMKYSDDTNLYFSVSHHLRGGFIVSKRNNKRFLFLLNTNPKKIKMLEKIMINNNFKVRNKMNIIDEFLNFKKNNSKFENIYRLEYEELLRKSEVNVYKLNNRSEKLRLNLINQNLRLSKNSSLYKINLSMIAQIENENLYVKSVMQTSFTKLLILSISILTFRIMPEFSKKFFLNLKQKNRSNKYLNKNIPLIRSLLMLPNLSLISIIINRVNRVNRINK